MSGAVAQRPEYTGVREVAGGEPASIQDFAADLALRTALIDLRMQESPGPEDYRLAARAIEIALSLDPTDADIARRWAEAALPVGDPVLLREATEALVRLDPEDTVAQLRLIAGRIASQQTVEGRLRLYDRFLGEGGARLDPSVRSRLALDAALLYRELGDVNKFAETLVLSSQLDGTNKEAATLATTYYARELDDPVDLMRLQMQLLRADPIDPNIRFSISKLLATEGAIGQSLRAYAWGKALLDSAGVTSPLQDVEQLSLQWQAQGAQHVLEEVEKRLAGLQEQAKVRYEIDIQNDVPDSELVPPEDVHLDPLYEKMRTLAGLAAGDDEVVQTGLDELERIARLEARVLEETNQRALTPELVAEIRNALAVRADLNFMRAIANTELDAFERDLTQYRLADRDWQTYVAPLRPWLLFRRGDTAAAMNEVERLGDLGEVTDLLRALIYESQGRSNDAIAIYRTLIRERPLGSVASWCWSRILGLEGRQDPLTDAGRVISQIARAIPTWIDRAALDATRFMGLTAEAEAESIVLGLPRRVRIGLINASPIPLGVGADRVLNSRMLLIHQVGGLAEMRGELEPEVIEMNRRLRLRDRQTLQVSAPAETGYNALLFQVNADQMIRERWRVIQGFELNRYGSLVPGPLCLGSETKTVVRPAAPEAAFDPGALAEAVRTGEGGAFVGALWMAGSRLFVASESEFVGDIDAGFVEALVPALADRFRGASDLERVAILHAVPAASQLAAMEPFDAAVREVLRDEFAALGGSELSDGFRGVLAAAILTRVTEEAEAVVSFLTASDPVLADLAALHASRIEAGRRAYATQGPGFQSLAPTVLDRERIGLDEDE